MGAAAGPAASLSNLDVLADEIGLELPMPPTSLIGVEALFEEDVLVEIEATALVD